MNMDKERITQSIETLNKKYPDSQANSFKSVGGDKEKPLVVTDESYSRKGMKQSKFHFVEFNSCIFDSTALTGSQFHHVCFKNTKIYGSSFACCDLYDTFFYGSKYPELCANNFSLSTFEGCSFFDMRFQNSGMLSSTFHNCVFKNVTFRSSTLEGTRFTKCKLTDCDISSVNVEFISIANSLLENVTFPFYQFPYVIGAANYIMMSDANIGLSTGEKTVALSEFRNALDDLIRFFADKHEYFPMCNLAIAKDDVLSAREFLKDGIREAMAGHNRDFRMVRYFCQLALHHEIMDEQTRCLILDNLNEFLLQKDIPEQQLNYYMTYAGNIRTMLMKGGSESVTVHLEIRTNVDRKNVNGIEFVNKLVQDLNEALAQAEDKIGFQVSISNYSPYEIIVEVLTNAGSVASIAGLVWQTVEASNKRKQKKAQIEFRNMIGTRIDDAQNELLRLQSVYSKHKFSKHITEIMQQLKTDVDDLYSSNVKVFKVTNRAGKPEKD